MIRPFSIVIFTAVLSAAPDDALQIIEQNCVRCHNRQTRMSGLSLVSLDDALRGGMRGAALVPGNAAKSLLLQFIAGNQPKMPAGAPPLKPIEVVTISSWVTEGAQWRRELGKVEWWSLKPLTPLPIPATHSEVGNPIDAFVRKMLVEKGLTPSLEADQRTLIRRLTFDLHGLPPSWEETLAFVGDKSPHAYERLVDRLLASPRYGERWGRHWLDVVHYGESHGYDKDKPRRNAWPYRDYVIRSLNNDKPYDRFVREQLAGDVLWPDNGEAVTATGFIAAGPWDFVGHAELREGTVDKKITRLLDRDDMVMTAMSAFTSMTAHCARCHNHKFDPISQEDYYSLQAVFAGVDRAERPYDDDPTVAAARNRLMKSKRVLTIELQPLLDFVDEISSPAIEQLDVEIAELRRRLTDKPDPAGNTSVEQMRARRRSMVESLIPQEKRDAIARLRTQSAEIDAEIAKLPKPNLVYAASSFFPIQGKFRPPLVPREVNLLNRGSVEHPGKEVMPGALSCLPLPARFEHTADEGQRRIALANWIAHRDNMLTWRSIVNRVWHHHFGAGLVESTNDFGRMGSLPSNPQLLDWLAIEFRDSMRGSFKKLHRLIVTSAAYRQSSLHDAKNAAVDGENRFLWRMNRTRLDAESIRDAALAVSGKLDLKMGGPSAEQFHFKDDHSPVYDYTKFDVDSAASYRRSVYRFIVRSVPDPFMDRLDCPDPSLITAKRNVSITAIQALATLNNPFMVRQSEHLAERVSGMDQPGRWVYRTLFARDPTPPELAKTQAYREKHGLANLCRILLNSNEFTFID